jgi:hypothetical protein
MKLANLHAADQSWLVRFLSILALGLPLLTLFGCGKAKNQWEDFSPVGAWEVDKDRFVFDVDGKFRKEVPGPSPSSNPRAWLWKGEWRKEGGKILVTYIEWNSRTGQEKELVLKILREDCMFVRNRGQFQRVKLEAAPGA